MKLFKLLDNKYAASAVLLFCAFSVAYIAYANVDIVENAQEENVEYRMEQEVLKQKNDGLRSKLQALEADVQRTKDEIDQNKAAWHEFKGMIKKNQDLIDAANALQGLE